MKLSYVLAVCISCWANLQGFGQKSLTKDELTFMFYNTENFFDTENDSVKNDEEYTPEGNRRWNKSRMHFKAERLAKVILAAGKWNPPVVVGLCEVENLQVLEVLTQNEPLRAFQYKIVQKDSPDERGIDVALIYRAELFHPFAYEAIPVTDPNDNSFKTRDILLVSGVLNDCDTLYFFVNHWPSRYGGLMETVRYRQLAAKALKKAILELQAKQPAAKIVCMGDFNDTPIDQSIAGTLGAEKLDNSEKSGQLVNLSFGWQSDEIQTIKSKYSWDTFDQWIVSDYFLQNNNCFRYENAEIFKPAFLLEPDLKFGGVKPKRTYVGYKYQEGFSDHLPVLLHIRLFNH